MELLGIKIDKFTKDQVVRHCQNTAVSVRYFSDLIEYQSGNSMNTILAAELHDVGKLKWKNRLFVVPFRELTKKDWNKIYAHPINGIEIIEESGTVKNFGSGNPSVSDIIYLHHERPDGKGYYGITDIPIEAAILHIADVFNACIITRPYKNAMPVNVAVKEATKAFIGYFQKPFINAIEFRLKEIYSLKDEPVDEHIFSQKNIVLAELMAIQKIKIPHHAALMLFPPKPQQGKEG